MSISFIAINLRNWKNGSCNKDDWIGYNNISQRRFEEDGDDDDDDGTYDFAPAA
ncbi:hypothetical protein BVRB_8g195370 [Beta vulgaris subsp. vulgaris]|nr:hypothetical protein BVRB_8g195370 [Beta vulgaris subsp. vulgaris]